jgi:type I restriction enzyme M protein
VWSIAEILRGDFKQFEYGKVILPFIVVRRLDCFLEASKGGERSIGSEAVFPVKNARKALYFMGSYVG